MTIRLRWIRKDKKKLKIIFIIVRNGKIKEKLFQLWKQCFKRVFSRESNLEKSKIVLSIGEVKLEAKCKIFFAK